jgi:hypothetical protein
MGCQHWNNILAVECGEPSSAPYALDTLLLKTTADAAKSEMLRVYLVLYRSPRGGESAFVID